MNASNIQSSIDAAAAFARERPIIFTLAVAQWALIGALIWLLRESGIEQAEHKVMLVNELRETRREAIATSDNLVQHLKEQSPTRIDEKARTAFQSEIKRNQETLEHLQRRQNAILMKLDQITIHISHGRSEEVRPGR